TKTSSAAARQRRPLQRRVVGYFDEPVFDAKSICSKNSPLLEPRHRSSAWGTAPHARGASGRDPLAPRLGHGHDFQQVAVGVFEVESPSAPTGVELAVGMVEWSAAVGKPLGLHSVEDSLEFRLADMEGVVMALACPGVEPRPAPGFWRVGEVQSQAFVDL